MGGIGDGHHSASMPIIYKPTYLGGIGDGHHSASMPIIYKPTYLGGIGDGHHSASMPMIYKPTYLGGIGDGHTTAGTPMIYSTVYLGGLGDGHTTAFMPEIPAPPFVGGIGDGHTTASMPEIPAPPFVGGIGDGHITATMPTLPSPPFVGGIGDGHHSKAMDQPKPWPYMGGIADGHVSMQVPGIFYPLYVGGQSDGFAKRGLPCDTTKYQIYADSAICIGDTLFLETDSVPSASYIWRGPDGWRGDGMRVNRPGFTAKMAGTYTVTIDPGCADAEDLPMAMKVIEAIIPDPVYAVIDSIVPNMPYERMCFGDSAVFAVHGFGWGDSALFDWRINGNSIGEPTHDSVVLLAGIDDGFNVTVAVYSSLSCVDARPYVTKPIRTAVDEKKTVNVKIACDIDQSLDSIVVCRGYPVRFSSSYVNQGDDPRFIWLRNNDTILNGTQDYIVLDSLKDGDSIRMLLISSIRCVDCRPKVSNTIRFTVKDQPVLKVPGTQEINLGESVTLGVGGGSEQAEYTWSPCASSCKGDTVVASPRTSTRYKVTLTEPWRCQVEDTIWVEVFTDVRILNHAQPTTVCDSSQAKFEVKASGAELSFDWQVDQGDGVWRTIKDMPKPNPYSEVQASGFTSVLYVGLPKKDSVNATISQLNLSMNNYKYRCRVSGVTDKTQKRDTLYSNDPEKFYGTARLFINPLQTAYGTISFNTKDTVCEGTPVTFTLKTQNSLAANYSINWLVNGVSKQTGRGMTYTLPKDLSKDSTLIQALITTGYACPSENPEPTETVMMPAFKNPQVHSGADGTVIVQYNTRDTLRGKVVSTGMKPGEDQKLVYAWTPANKIEGATDQLKALTTPVQVPVTYTFAATNAHGCKGEHSHIVSLKGGKLSASVVNITACENDTVRPTVTPWGGSGIYSFAWTALPQNGTPADPNFVSADTSVLTLVSPVGVTDYRVRVSDGVDSVVKTIRVTVNKRMLSQPVLVGDTNYCANTTNTFKLRVQNDAYAGRVSMYRWYVNDTLDARFDGSIEYSSIPKDGSRVHCEVTVGYACPAENPVNTPKVGIHIFPIPELTKITGDTTICPGTSIQLSVTGKKIDSLSWTPKDEIVTGANATSASQTVIAKPSVSTVYNIGLFTNKGCVVNYKVNVNVHPVTAATTQSPTIYACESGEARLPVKTSGVDLVYDWQKLDGGSWNSVTNTTKYGDLNTPQLLVRDVALTEDGDQYRLHVSGLCQPDSTSAPITLHVIDSVYFDIELVDTPRCENDPAKIRFITNLKGLEKKIDVVIKGSYGTRSYITRDSVYTIRAVYPNDRVQAYLTPQGIIAQCVTPNPMPSSIIDLGVKEAPSLTYKAVNPKACATNDGSITLNVTRGNLPYTYYFDGEANTNNVFDNLGAGMYVAGVTDNNGCQSKDVEISLRDPNGPVEPVVSNAGFHCAADGLPGFLLLDPKTKKADIKWHSDSRCTNLIHTGDSMAFPTAPGLHTYYLYQQFGNCKSGTVRVDVFVGQMPSIDRIDAVVPSSCDRSDGIISVYATGDTTLEYSIYVPQRFGTNSDFIDLPNATYPVAVRTLAGCTVYDTVELYAYNTPDAP
ncbi:MAG: hypothetical protein NC324_08270, partial [Bacteroides sp.]|nr:hypothetical protein [Bacteroides sp.]